MTEPNDTPEQAPSEQAPSEQAPSEQAPSEQTQDSSKPQDRDLRRNWSKRAAGWVAAAALPLTFFFGMWAGAPNQPEAKTAATAKEKVWTCSMHPQIKLPDRGKCPICGMDLIPLQEDQGGGDPMRQVVLSDRAKVLARIKTMVVQRGDTAIELRLLGRLEYDETGVRTITPWTGGRVDRLFVNNVGAKIKRGQVVASLYSPEIYAAQSDLLIARRQMKRLLKAVPTARDTAEAALESSRQRLRLLGVPPEEVKAMGKQNEPSRNVAVFSVYSGTVVEQLVHEGAYVKAGTPMYRISNLSKIWAQLDAYEGDLPRVSVSQKVSLTVSSFPGERFEGTVAFVDPIVDPRTRTAQIRVEVPNDKGRLSPGMFADAIVHTPQQARADHKAPMVIPATAPLFTGQRSVVYVELPKRAEPTYEVREVVLGPRAGQLYPVMSGLKEGERVVVRGAFALDSDLQIRGGHSMMSREDDRDREARAPVRTDARFMQGLGAVVGAYLDLQKKLAADELESAKRAFAILALRVSAFKPQTPRAARDLYRTIAAPLGAAAKRGAKASELAHARRAFHETSDLVVEALVRFGNPVETVKLASCPMALDGKGGKWLQTADKVENPYFGAQMFRCGDIEQTVGKGDHLGPPKPPATPPSSAAAGHEH